MTLDEVILEELKQAGAACTVKDVQERLSQRVYAALERLVVAEKVIEEGFPGKGNQKTYRLPKPAAIKRRI
jgi:hypothetical protein